jgi:vacuolar protein sorting-associated protein 13A/C
MLGKWTRRLIFVWHLQVIGVWAAYKVNNIEESVVMASLERLSLKDEREGTDPEMQYMIGHADDSAPNTLEGDPVHAQRNKTEKTENDTAVGTSSTKHGWGYVFT